MECPFSSGQMEGVSSLSDGVHDLNLENSFGNVAEHMSFDAYVGLCNSTSDLSDQMFPTFALSPFTSPLTNFLPFDGLNFTNQYSSEISIVDDDITGNSFISGDKRIFHQKDNHLPFATDCPDEGFDLIETNDKIHSVLSRPPLHSLTDKMLRALELFQSWSGEGILAQVWVPLQNGDQCILSTSEQPYLLDHTLSGYREVSRSFTFATETKPGCFLGLPGRVFVSKIPEWTSNVLYYKEAEYLRVKHAADHEVRGSIALPVFQDDSLGKSCCAVLELVTVKEKSNFDREMEHMCRALEAVNLRSVVPRRLYPQIFSQNQKAALAEIADVLRAICVAHRLPLALTWIPCSYVNDAGDVTHNLHPEGKYILCLENTASYVNDKDMEGFVHACENHYLKQGQGIVGKALESNHPFFYHDVKEYHINEYPLVLHARKFGLNAAVAIKLRSLYTGDRDYILEFFLPVNTRGSAEQQFLLNNLSSTMQKICKSLRTVSDAELHSMECSKDKFQDADMTRILEMSLSSGNLKIVDPINQDLSESTATGVEVDVPLEQIKPMSKCKSRKQMPKVRRRAEKHVSFSVLQKYFPGSLSNAAKNIGVCQTTLKRICRQYGILRWPSRKIHKVNRSLKNIQRVLNSVQGSEGGLKFDPTTGGFVSAGSVIQELDSRDRAALPNKNDNHLRRDSGFIIHNSKSATTLENETTILLDGSQVADESKLHPLHVQHQESIIASLDAGRSAALKNMPSMIPNIQSGSLFSRKISITTPVVDLDDGVDHNPPTSSGMTNSSIGSGYGSGSMMNDSSSSSRSFGKMQIHKSDTSWGDSGSKLTVKATYKEDTVRFKFQPASGYLQLCEEVARRFKLHIGQFQLKYLDDEDEWVMLVNDSDLQECVEILESMGTHNVKFLVRDVPSTFGSSGGSNCFLGERS